MRAALDDAGEGDGAGGFCELGEFVDRGGGAPVVGAAGVDADQDGAFAGRVGGMFGGATAANERLRIRDTAVRCAVGCVGVYRRMRIGGSRFLSASVANLRGETMAAARRAQLRPEGVVLATGGARPPSRDGRAAWHPDSPT